jgi:hypothetical protein
MTRRQDSLSGVIICPAYWKGQRLRANSFATTYISIKDHKASIVKDWTIDLVAVIWRQSR